MIYTKSCTYALNLIFYETSEVVNIFIFIYIFVHGIFLLVWMNITGLLGNISLVNLQPSIPNYNFGHSERIHRYYLKQFSVCVVLDQINVDARKAVHVGDDKKADKIGANAIGIDCW